jgi:hypothetical protein
MARDFVFDAPTPTTSSEGPKVDFDKMNQYIVDTIDARTPDPRIGIISGIVDLGLQKQEDAKMAWTGDAASEAAEIEKNPAQYFETLPNDKGVQTRYKRWEVKPQREVALFVDFPDNLINRGQFHDVEGGGEELPYRMLLNNEFYQKGIGKIVGKPYSLREQRNDDGSWGFKNNTILYKLGQAADVLDEKGNMKPAYLGKLIGKAGLFNVTVTLNEHDGKKYLSEKIGFNGAVPKVMQKMVPTLADEQMFLINFKGAQDETAIKNLRQCVINTMKQAVDFEGSDIQKALIAAGKIKEGDGAASTSSESKPAQNAPQASKPDVNTPAVDFDSFDSDIPF